MIGTIRRAALLAALLALLWAPVAQAYTYETLITAADVTTDQYSSSITNQGTASVYYFKLDMTAWTGTGSYDIRIQYYDHVDDEWDQWMAPAGCTVGAVDAECVVVVIAKGTEADHNTVQITALDDVDVVWVVPMPGKWRVRASKTGTVTAATFTVTHWRY